MDEKKNNEFLLSLIRFNYNRNCGVYLSMLGEEQYYLFDDDRNFEFFISYKCFINLDEKSNNKKLSVIKMLNFNACFVINKESFNPLKAIEIVASKNNYDGVLVETLNYESVQNIMLSNGYVISKIPTENDSLFTSYLKLFVNL